MNSDTDNFNIDDFDNPVSIDGIGKRTNYNYHFKIIPVSGAELSNIDPVECVKFIDVSSSNSYELGENKDQVDKGTRPRIFKLQVRDDNLRIYITELDDKSIGCPYKKNYGTVDDPIWGCTYEFKTVLGENGIAKPSADENTSITNFLDHLDSIKISNEKAAIQNLIESLESELAQENTTLGGLQADLAIMVDPIKIRKQQDLIEAQIRVIENIQQKINREKIELGNFYTNQGYSSDRLAQYKNEADYPLTGGDKEFEDWQSLSEDDFYDKVVTEIYGKYWGCPKYKLNNITENQTLEQKYKDFLFLFKDHQGGTNIENELNGDFHPENTPPYSSSDKVEYDQKPYDYFIPPSENSPYYHQNLSYLTQVDHLSRLIKILTKINMHIAKDEYFAKYDVPEDRDFVEYGDANGSYEPVCHYNFSNIVVNSGNVIESNNDDIPVYPINDALRQSTTNDGFYNLDKISRTSRSFNNLVYPATYSVKLKKYRPIVMPKVKEIFNMTTKVLDGDKIIDQDIPHSGWNIIPYKMTSIPEYQEGGIVIPTSYDLGNNIDSDNFLNIDFDFYKREFVQDQAGNLIDASTGAITSTKSNALFGPIISNESSYGKFKPFRSKVWLWLANALDKQMLDNSKVRDGNTYYMLKTNTFNFNNIFPGFSYESDSYTYFDQIIAGKKTKSLDQIKGQSGSETETSLLTKILNPAYELSKGLEEVELSLAGKENVESNQPSATWFYVNQAPSNAAQYKLPNEIKGLTPWLFSLSFGGNIKSTVLNGNKTTALGATSFSGGDKSKSGSDKLCSTVTLDLSSLFPTGVSRSSLTLYFHSWINEISHSHYSDLYCKIRNVTSQPSFMICRYYAGARIGNLTDFGDGVGNTSDNTYDSRYHDRTWVNCKYSLNASQLNSAGNQLILDYYFNWSDNGKGGGREAYVGVDTYTTGTSQSRDETVYLAYGVKDDMGRSLDGALKFNVQPGNVIALNREGNNIVEVSSFGASDHPYQASWNPIYKFAGYDLRTKFKSLDPSPDSYKGFFMDQYNGTSTKWIPRKSSSSIEQHTGENNPFTSAVNKLPTANWSQYINNQYWKANSSAQPQSWYLWNIVRQQAYNDSKATGTMLDMIAYEVMMELYLTYIAKCSNDSTMTSTFIKVLSVGMQKVNGDDDRSNWSMLIYTGHDMTNNSYDIPNDMNFKNQTFILNNLKGTQNHLLPIQNISNILNDSKYSNNPDFKNLNTRLTSVSLPNSGNITMKSCYGSIMPFIGYGDTDMHISNVKTRSIIIPVFPNWDILKDANGMWKVEPTVDDFKKIFFQVIPVSVYQPYKVGPTQTTNSVRTAVSSSRFFAWKIASLYLMTSRNDGVDNGISKNNEFKGSSNLIGNDLPTTSTGILKWEKQN